MPTKKRVVITGAAGFIGSHLAQTLLDLDYSVVGIDNLLGERQNISKPLLLHIAMRDKFSSPEAQAKVRYHQALLQTEAKQPNNTFLKDDQQPPQQQ